MNRKKALLSLLLIAALLLSLLGACSNTEEPAPQPDSQTPGDTTPPADSGDPADSGTPEGGYTEDDATDIYVSYMIFSTIDSDETARIEEAMNAITVPEFGLNVHLMIWDIGSYATQAGMRIAGGEPYDVINIVPMMTMTSMYSNNQLLECRELLETYAPEALEALGSLTDAYSMGGGLYGLPNLRILSSNGYYVMRKDVLEACGQLEAAEACDSWSDFEAIMAAVKPWCDENNLFVMGGQKSIAPFGSVWDDDSFASGYIYETAGDSTSTLMVDTDTNTVSCLWQNEQVVDVLERCNTWNEAGYLYPEAIIGNDMVDNLMRQNVVFCYPTTSEFGVENSKQQATGYEVVCPMTSTGSIGTAGLNQFGVGIPATSEEPEAAAQFINLLFTDARIVNLFAWGVEGEDYVMVDGEACYPSEDAQVYHQNDFMLGNQYLIAPWQGSGADFRERAKEINDAAPRSPYLGFLLDTGELATTIAAVNSCVDEFRPDLTCGNYSDERRDDFIEKLNTAGLQEYISSIQTQLDAWLAQQ